MHNLNRDRKSLLRCGQMFPLLGERVRVRGKPCNLSNFHRFSTIAHWSYRKQEPDKQESPHPGTLPSERE